MIVHSIESIWISPGITSGETPETHYAVGNTDVIVYFLDASSYVASFFTYESITRITQRHQRTGECLSGKYFWSSDMILIDRIDRKSIEIVIQNLLADGTFQRVFKRL